MTWSIRILNWRKFQHYDKKSPPWIKVHRDLTDRRQWRALHGSAAKLLVDLWLLAASEDKGPNTEGSGDIHLPLGDVAWRIRVPEAEMLADLQVLTAQEFVEVSSEALEAHYSASTPETETETEQRQRKSNTSPAATDEEKAVYRTIAAKCQELLWAPDGEPPEGTTVGAQCAMGKNLMANRNLNVGKLLLLIDGLGFLRRGLADPERRVPWLEGQKVSLKVLFAARCGKFAVRDLAEQAYWWNQGKRHGKPSPPAKLEIPNVGIG